MKPTHIIDPKFQSWLNIWQANVGQPHWHTAYPERIQAGENRARVLRSERFHAAVRPVWSGLLAIGRRIREYHIDNLTQKQLMRLNDAHLRDIGLTRDDVRQRRFNLVDDNGHGYRAGRRVVPRVHDVIADGQIDQVGTGDAANDPNYRAGHRIA